MQRKRSQQGFTLIELLTVVAIIALLASIAISSFLVYRQNAAFGVLQRLGGDVQQNLEISASSDVLPPAFNADIQLSAGPLVNVNARKVLDAVKLPSQTSFAGRYNPGCQSSGCESAFIELRHQKSVKYLQLLRAGDGVWARVEQAG